MESNISIDCDIQLFFFAGSSATKTVDHWHILRPKAKCEFDLVHVHVCDTNKTPLVETLLHGATSGQKFNKVPCRLWKYNIVITDFNFLFLSQQNTSVGS